MKVQECNNESLINKYYPVDHEDSSSRVLNGVKELTPDDFLNLTFSKYPKWIDWLLSLRAILVKPLNLKTDDKLINMVQDRTENEIIIGKQDKHLTFYCSLWCSPKENNKQILSITTIVKYNNSIGKLYFFVIRPFHKIIIYYILKRAVNIASNMK